MITDGKPSALFEDGRLYMNPFGLDRKIVNKTLDEAAECRRHRIPITTFMVAQDPLLVRFVENLTKVNQGRAFFSRPRQARADGLRRLPAKPPAPGAVAFPLPSPLPLPSPSRWLPLQDQATLLARLYLGGGRIPP